MVESGMWFIRNFYILFWMTIRAWTLTHVFKLIDSWIKTIDINLNAVIKGTQLGIQFLKKRGGGVIINTGL